MAENILLQSLGRGRDLEFWRSSKTTTGIHSGKANNTYTSAKGALYVNCARHERRQLEHRAEHPGREEVVLDELVRNEESDGGDADRDGLVPDVGGEGQREQEQGPAHEDVAVQLRRDISALRRETESLGITGPIVTDNEYATWNAYHQQYWPVIYLVDKRGTIRFVHIGEGGYAETEAMIARLIAE